MGIIVKNQKLNTGITSDFYYKLNYYKSDERGFLCVVSSWANFDVRKNQPSNYFEQKRYVIIENPPAFSKEIKSLTPKEMFVYVYECLTVTLDGEQEATFSAKTDLMNNIDKPEGASPHD